MSPVFFSFLFSKKKKTKKKKSNVTFPPFLLSNQVLMMIELLYIYTSYTHTCIYISIYTVYPYPWRSPPFFPHLLHLLCTTTLCLASLSLQVKKKKTTR